MVLYIWLLYHQIVIMCNEGGCLQVSMAHFNYIHGLGVLEVILELGGIVKIFKKNRPHATEGPKIDTTKK